MSGVLGHEMVDHISLDGVSIVTLNRPEKSNALNFELVDSLTECVRSAEEIGDQALIFRSAGGNFCAGIDLDVRSSSRRDVFANLFVKINRLLQRIHSARLITVAAIGGAAYGAGADLALACTHRVGCESSVFAFPGVNFGVLLGTRRLASEVGAARAQSILLSGARVFGERACADGLLTRLVRSEEISSEAELIASSAVGVEFDVADFVSMTNFDSDLYGEAELVRSLQGDLFDRFDRYVAGAFARS